MVKVISSDKNKDAREGDIYHSNRPSSGNDIQSALDTAGVGKNAAAKGKGLVKKGVGEARQAAGRAAGIGNAIEQARDFKAMRSGSMKEKFAAGKRTAIRGLGEAGALATFGNQELAPVYQKALEILTSRKFLQYAGIALIAIGIVLFTIFDQQIFDNTDDQQQNNTPTTNDTCVPAQFTGDAFGKTSVCTITVTYNGSADDVSIIDTILPGTAFVSSGQKGTFDQPSNSITWDAAQLKLPLNPINITITVTVRVTTHQNNTTVYNAYSINPTNLQNGTSSVGGGNVPPNQSTCNGKYNLLSQYDNFGDPQCNFTVQQFGQEVKQMDPSNYLIWDCMASHESGYDPNAYNPGSTSGKGAYGLLQMNPSGQGNGQYDAGNVNWPLQISNAINYNQKEIGGSFAYWATYAGCH